MASRTPWNDQELELLMNAYFFILNKERAGERVNKAQIRRDTLAAMAAVGPGRSNGSYEMKMMNVSAAMVALELPHINGYKPYGHGQKLITDIIKAHLERARRAA